MGRELGRISGPLLADNLKRNGQNLAFDNSLLYLDVNNNYIGINSLGSSSALTIGTTKNNNGVGSSTLNTINLIGTVANIGNFTVSGHTIQHLTGGITLSPNQASNPTIVTPGLSTNSLYFYSNNLTTTVTNDPINISPNGTGQINLANDNGSVQVTVNANLHATGNITWDGNITFGTNASERITFVAELNSDLLPNVPTTLITPVSLPYYTQDGQILLAQDGTTLYTNPAAPYYQPSYLYDLGSSSLEWLNFYATTLNAVSSGTSGSISSTTSTIGNFTISGNSFTDSNYDINFTTTGTGQVKINGNLLPISGSSITNNTNSAFTLNSTGYGYVKFSGANGLIIPAGTSNNRPYQPQQGATRYNSTIGYGEIYYGDQWIPVGGNSAVLSSDQVQDVMWAWDVILG